MFSTPLSAKMIVVCSNSLDLSGDSFRHTRRSTSAWRRVRSAARQHRRRRSRPEAPILSTAIGPYSILRNMSNIKIDGLETFAGAFKALSNRHRLSIFLRLASCCRPGTKCEPAQRSCVGDIGAELGIAPSTVSHHLKELRQAGLIRTERQGQTVECWVAPEMLETMSGFFRIPGTP